MRRKMDALRKQHPSFWHWQNKTAAAVYLYQVDNDGEWGEISFYFEAGTAEIIRLVERDTTVSRKFAEQLIRHLQPFQNHNLPKDDTIIFQIFF